MVQNSCMDEGHLWATLTGCFLRRGSRVERPARQSVLAPDGVALKGPKLRQTNEGGVLTKEDTSLQRPLVSPLLGSMLGKVEV